MPQRYGGRNLVNILTAWTCRSGKSFLEFGLANAKLLRPFPPRMLRHHNVLTIAKLLGELFCWLRLALRLFTIWQTPFALFAKW
jgi:hypothetical protein